ncbi:uncharacterized protein [Physcomitrium patens]|uniref:uncharacterized protein isoform X2 n=1 Tax=Physcomitrium patens TaxID=3218 RepID=UPI003CCD8B86
MSNGVMHFLVKSFFSRVHLLQYIPPLQGAPQMFQNAFLSNPKMRSSLNTSIYFLGCKVIHCRLLQFTNTDWSYFHNSMVRVDPSEGFQRCSLHVYHKAVLYCGLKIGHRSDMRMD